MQRDDEIGCATEVAEGSAYQSWDWSNAAKEGAEFQEIDSGKSSLWQSALEAGDSLWHHQVWDCKTKLDTIGQYEISTLHELDWLKLISGTWPEGFVLQDPSWIKLFFNETDVSIFQELIMKKLTTFKEDKLILSDPSWMLVRVPHMDSAKFIESARIVFTRNFNEGFFKLVEDYWLDVNSLQEDKLIFADNDVIKLYLNNEDDVILSESWWMRSAKKLEDICNIYELVEKYLKTFETDVVQIFDFSYLKPYLNNSDYTKFIEALKIIFTRNFNEGYFKIVEKSWLEVERPEEDSFAVLDESWLNSTLVQNDICDIAETVWSSMKKVLVESVNLQEVFKKVCNVSENDLIKIAENNYYKTYLNNLDKVVLIELLRIVFTRNFNEGFFKLVESLKFEMTMQELDNIKIVENIQNFLEVEFTDALKIYEVLVLETVTAVAEIFKLSDSSFLETHSSVGDNGKLIEVISLAVFSGGGYGINGYGVVGYGV